MSASEKTVLLNSDTYSESSENVQEKRTRSLTTIALAAAMLVQSFLLVGVFPYSGFMAMQLVPGLNEETSGSYAGLIACSFMVGRTASSFGWGQISDKYGRVFVIRASLLLSAVFSILFGLSSNFYLALLWRGILGLCNGIIGPVKVLVTEYNRGDRNKETEMMGLVIGTWGLGFLINPAITGFLSEPAKQFPESFLVRTFEPLLTAFPFLLPNVVGSLFCLIADGLVHSFVEETLPLEQREFLTLLPCKKKLVRTASSCGLLKQSDEDPETDGPASSETGSLMPEEDVVEWSGELTVEWSGDFSLESSREFRPPPATLSSLLRREATREHLLVYWAYSFLIVGLEESFPLYCLSKASGMAIGEKIIGEIFSGSGFFFITIQYFLLTGLVKRFGFYKTLTIGGFASVPFSALIPLTLITNRNAPEGSLTILSFMLLSGVYAVVQVFSVLVISTLTMTTNRTVPPHHRGTMQGLSMVGGSIAKAAGPAFSGIFFSSSVRYFIPPTGSIVVFGLFSFLGICVALKMGRLQIYENSLM